MDGFQAARPMVLRVEYPQAESGAIPINASKAAHNGPVARR